jgi:hypothetical protein
MDAILPGGELVRARNRMALRSQDALKADAVLRTVPVIVLAGSLSPLHIQELYAN